MPTWETMAAVAAAGLALSATPGPSMLYVLSRSVGQSRAAGIASAIGLGLGGIMLAVLAALGLAVVFAKSPTAQYVLKFAGAGYLVYLGAQMILDARRQEMDDFRTHAVRKASFARIVWQGVLVEVLNPKTVLFFLLFIPTFVESRDGDMVLQLLVLGVLVPLTAVPADVIVAFIGGSLAQKVRDNPKASLALGVVGGLVLIGIGLSILF